jgi:hypothetical protein
MTEVTKELIFRTLQRVAREIGALSGAMQDARGQIKSLQFHTLATHHDIQNINAILVRHETRLDRIGRRLEILEIAEVPK